MEFVLNYIDRAIFFFLKQNVDVMPKRFTKLIANYYTDARIRKLYWKKLGVDMGENTFPNLGFQSTSNGENLVFIGNNVSIGPNVVMIPDSSANNGLIINQIPYVSEKLTKKSKIVVHDDVWLGVGVKVLPGVTIGTCSVIGAGSVVVADVEPFCVYAGIPAKKIRSFGVRDDSM